MPQVAPLILDQHYKPLKNIISLAAITRSAAKRQSWLAQHRPCNSRFKVTGFVPGKEQPRSRLHPLRIEDTGFTDTNRSNGLHIRHSFPHAGDLGAAERRPPKSNHM